MPRFVKWSKKLRTQEYWTIHRGQTSYLIQEGDLKGRGKGPFQTFATAEEMQRAYDAEIAKKLKSRFWQLVPVPEVPMAVGAKQRYERDGFAWEIEVLDATQLDTTNYRGGEPAGGNLHQYPDETERNSGAELLIAEKLATGYVRVDDGIPRTSAFMYTGYSETIPGAK